MPKKPASSVKAVNVSWDNSGPWTGPDIFDSTLQFVPNWKAITTPDTTPRPNAMPNILSQNSKRTRYTGRSVLRCIASRTVSQAAIPMVKAGKMIWNEMVKPNCIRDKRRAVASIAKFPLRSGPKVRPGEIDKIVAAAAKDSFHHVKREPLGHFSGDGGWNGEHGAAYHRIDQHRSVMRERGGDTLINLRGVLEPDPAHARRFGHGGKVGVLEAGAVVEKAGGLLLDLDETERAVVEHHDLHRQSELRETQKIAHQHGEAPVSRQRDHLPARKRGLRANRMRHGIGHR